MNSNSGNRIDRERTVVVVEDNENVARLIANRLSNAGFRVKTFNFGSAAVLYALNNSDSLLLIEYYMPDMTAKDIVRSIEGNNKKIPYVVMSEPGNEKTIIEMMKMGARDFLVKEKGFMDFLPAAVNKIFEQIDVENKLASVEKSLRFSRDKFRHIFNSIADAIYIYDFHGNLLELNNAAYRRTGLAKIDDDTNISYLDFQIDEFRENFPEFIETLSEKEQVRFESKEKDSEGNLIAVDCLTRKILYDDENAVLTISRDINEFVKIKELLKKNEQRFQRITNTISDYIVTVYIENNQAVKTMHSPACEHVTGYKPEELEEQPYLWLDMIDTKDKELVLENVNRIINGEMVKPFEHRIIKKDGSVAWLRNTPVLHFNKDNKVTSYDGVIQDITEQKNTEEKLLDQQTRLMATINAFDGLLYSCSPDNKISYVNKKMIERTGYDPTGDFCYKAIHGRDDVCPWCRSSQDEQEENVKWEIKSPKDNRWYSVINMPITQSDGKKSKQSLVLDITDKKYADQELTKLNKLYYGLISELPLPIFQLKKKGDIVSANNAFYELFNSNKEQDETGSETIKEWIADYISSDAPKHTALEKKVGFEVNGNKKKKLLKLKTILDENDEIIEYHGILFDLS